MNNKQELQRKIENMRRITNLVLRVGAYLSGYIISLMQTGIPNVYYLIPIKLLSIIFLIMIWDMEECFRNKHYNILHVLKYGFKKAIIVTMVIYIFYKVYMLLMSIGISIEFIFGAKFNY